MDDGQIAEQPAVLPEEAEHQQMAEGMFGVDGNHDIQYNMAAQDEMQ